MPYFLAALSGSGGMRWQNTLSGGREGEQALDIPGHGHEAPLSARVFQSAQRKLTESEDRFDNAEYRLRGLFAQGIKRAALRRLHAMRHGFDRRRIFGRRQRWFEALLQRRIMRLTARRDQRFDSR